MVVESYMKQYPTNLRESREMQHLKFSPWLASRRQLIRGLLTIAHIAGGFPFPFPRPCGVGFIGRAHLSPSYVVSDSPKEVLA